MGLSNLTQWIPEVMKAFETWKGERSEVTLNDLADHVSQLGELFERAQDIGTLRRSLFMPYDCPWNGYVRDVTAEIELAGGLVPVAEVYARINQRAAELMGQQLNDAQGDTAAPPVGYSVAWPVRIEDFRKQHNGVFGIELFFGHDGHNVCRFKSYYHLLAEGESGRSMQEAVERCVQAFEKWRESMNKTVNVEELSKQRMVPGEFRPIPPPLKVVVDPNMPEGRIDVIDSKGRRPAITNLQESLCGIAGNVHTSINTAIHPTAKTAEPSEVRHLPDHEWLSLSKESQEKISKWFELAVKHLQAILDEPHAEVRP